MAMQFFLHTPYIIMLFDFLKALRVLKNKIKAKKIYNNNF